MGGGALIEIWLGGPVILNTAMAYGVVRLSSGGPFFTIDRTVFEMRLGTP